MDASERKGRDWAARVYREKLEAGDLPSLGRGYSPEVRAARAVQSIALRRLYVKAARSSVRLEAPMAAHERAFWRGVLAWSLEQEQLASNPEAWRVAADAVRKFVAKGGDVDDPIDREWLQSKHQAIRIESVIGRLRGDEAMGSSEDLVLEERGTGRSLLKSVDLGSYDLILVNTSGGKDSVVAMDLAVRRGQSEGVKNRMVAVHAVLEGMEWPGVLDLVKKQCRRVGLPLELVQAGGQWPSWYDYAAYRREWPGFGTRFCTRGWKGTPIEALVTVYKREWQRLTGKKQIRVLHVMGMRADESPERGARYTEYQHEHGRTNTERWTDLWLPLYDWTAPEVWSYIRKHRLPYHPIYDMGMERLSCVFCPLAGRHEIVQAAKVAYKLDPSLLRRAVEVEASVGKPIKGGSRKSPPIWLRDVQAALRAGRDVVAERDPAEPGEWCHPFADDDE